MIRALAHSLQFFRPILIAAAVMCVVWLAQPRQPAADTAPLAVVELFTSQGCSSCPPADALLGELAARADVLALSFHVDYWNYIGWADPFSDPAFTRRQRAYAEVMGARYVYTPQLVINGLHHVSGADRAEFNRHLNETTQRPATAVAVDHAGDDLLKIIIPGHDGSDPATIWLALYDARHETAVRAGENRDRRLVNYNVVREFRQIGVWHGKPTALTVAAQRRAGAQADSSPPRGAAILLQSLRTGQIVGAGRLAAP